MGIGKHFIQSLLFNAVNDNRTGLILQNKLDCKPDVIIFDHMLIMHSTCFLPLVGMISIEEHIIRNTLNYYMRYYRLHGTVNTLFVICEDGRQCVKPAVRAKRNEHAQTEALVFFKKNKKTLAEKLVAMLQDEALKILFISGSSNHEPITWRFSDGSGKMVVPQERDLRMDRFVETYNESESDTLMFAFAGHYREYFPTHLVLITTKDSDVIPCGMHITNTRGGEFLGNTVVEFKTSMFSFSKDFDRAVFDYRFMKPPMSEADERRLVILRSLKSDDVFVEREGMSETIKPLLWQMLFDSMDLAPFETLISRVKNALLDTPAGLRTFIKFMTACAKAGFRGCVFRRIMMRLCLDEEEHVETAKAFVAAMTSTGGDHLGDLRVFFERTPSFVTVRQIRKDGYVPDGGPGGAVDWSDGFAGLDRMSTYSMRQEALPLKVIKMLCNVIKMYNDRIITFDTYGKYVRANDTNGVKYVRFVAGETTRAAVIGSMLAGADYNLTVPLMGIAQLIKLMESKSFCAMCADAQLSPDTDGPAFIKRVLAHTRVSCKWTSVAAVDAFYDCVWRTMCYTGDVWNLLAPIPSVDYGFTAEDGHWYFKYQVSDDFKKSFKLGGRPVITN